MDEDNFEESRRAGSVDASGEMYPPHPVPTEKLPSAVPSGGRTSGVRTGVQMPDNPASRPSIVWVRASDLLSTGTGRIAGRGIDFEAELARRVRRTPTTTRRAISERADRLPPLSEFGTLPKHPPFSRYGLGRR
ncbi:hypothetical protein [Cryobacterium sp. TMT2-14]|uniref:hypothetical protein n=1 Tax=Cryobacterium sp. TMT2-14 TaxID=1259245 RepID=UPI001069A7E7|nr:hypothetical protein [Cryobacterium sp. TMT2-14]TFC34912.1 hypothetical protein E3O28_10910 [Cryobacterium sp. TMT2-14]